MFARQHARLLTRTSVLANLQPTPERNFTHMAGEKQWSWRVVGGENAAYDQFPCQ